MYKPIGVVVVPGIHNVYSDGACGVISLKYMSLINPNNGSNSANSFYWGTYETDIETLTNYINVPYIGGNGYVGQNIISNSGHGYFPSSDGIFTAVTNPYDIKTNYFYNDNNYYAPSPYLNDGSRNPIYYQTTEPSTTANCLSDFDGVGNTKILTDLATGQTDWKTASAITNSYSSGYYPSACCCWRYRTEGTNEGDWYLPAIGELGYLMVRFKTINDTIQLLIDNYGSEIASCVDVGGIWSSSEHNSIYVRSLGTNNGGCHFSDKKFTFYTRAFIHIKNYS